MVMKSDKSIPKLATSYDYWRYFTFQSQAFIRHIDGVRKVAVYGDTDRAVELADIVARQHKLKLEDIVLYIRSEITPDKPLSTTAARFEVDSKGKMTITLEDSATRAELLDAYKLFDEYRTKYLEPTKKKRRQTPRDVELLYAIDRMIQNQDETDWDTIFAKYDGGELPPSGSSYDTKYELQQYYYNNRLV